MARPDDTQQPPACPVCTQPNAELLVLRHFEFAPERVVELGIVQCAGCGLVYVRNPPPEDVLAEYFCEGEAYTKPELAAVGLRQRQRVLQSLLCMITKHLGEGSPALVGTPPFDAAQGGLRRRAGDPELACPEHRRRAEGPQRRLLDVGCSYGHFLQMARQAGFEAWGVEPSASGCAYAREHYELEHVLEGTLRAAHLPDDYFDVVTNWDVLYYVLHPVEEMQEMRRVLKPGGYAFLRVSNRAALLRALSRVHRVVRRQVPLLHGDRAWLWAHDALVYFEPQTIREVLERAGLEVLEVSPSLANALMRWTPQEVLRVCLGGVVRCVDAVARAVSGARLILAPSIVAVARRL